MKFIGLLTSAASGKLGGIVASHNRNGSYMRHHTIPVQPRTVAQRAVRNQLAGLSSAFRNLGASTIAGYNALAKTVTLKSKLGTTYNPTGLQLYVSCGRHLGEIGIVIGNMVAPTIPTIPALPALTMSTSGNGLQVAAMTITGISTLSSSYGAVIRATSPQSAGRTFMGKSAFRTLVGNANASALVADQFPVYTARFGQLPQAGIIQFAVKYIDPGSGFAGPEATVNFAFNQPVGVNLFTFVMGAIVSGHLSGHTAGTAAVTLTDNGGFAGAINWALTGLPYGATCTFSGGTPSTTLTGLTLVDTALTAGDESTYALTLTGTYGGYSYSQTFNWTFAA